MSLSRRRWLGAAALSAAPVYAGDSFTFVHVTDVHIQPERGAAEACRLCFEAINKVRPAFVVVGGDLVFDTLAVGYDRAHMLWDLYEETARRIEAPRRHLIGNHDVFGLYKKSGVRPAHASYGKKMYEDRMGARYYAFDHQSWRFIVLDSIGITPGRTYIGHIDDEQLQWLSGELERTGRVRPIVVATHIPLSTGFLQWRDPARHDPTMIVVQNSSTVLEMLQPYNVKAVLQGHTHVYEKLEYQGCQYITSGSVCGRSWTGPMLGAHPEGFGVITVKGGELRYRYQPYGWKARPA